MLRLPHVLLVLSVAACAPATRYAPLDSDGTHLRDRDGRAVILRGINARIEGVFDVMLDGGRVPLEEIPAFSAADARRMAELGFNLLRLPIHWSAIEPQPGAYSDAYLDRVAAVVALCREVGILVLLDFHQDAWSKEIGEDGAPLWAIVPPPEMLLEGPLDDLGDRRISAQVQRAFKSFFADNAMGLQESFARMAQKVAQRFVGDEAVLGYEIFNEPEATDDEVAAFNLKVARALREVDPAHLIAFEPSVYRNFVNASPLAREPFQVGGGLYAPHVYTAVFGNDNRLADGTFVTPLRESWAAAREEAAAWGTPLIVGEFGVGPTTPNGFQWLDVAFAAADEQLASTAFWLWKEQSQGIWGLFDPPDWRDRPAMIAAVSRPYPKAIGGDPRRVAWDGTTLTVELAPRGNVSPEHDVFFPRGTPTVSCAGQKVTPAPLGDATWRFRCDAASFTLR
jgi:endoglycosylceramidase